MAFSALNTRRWLTGLALAGLSAGLTGCSGPGSGNGNDNQNDNSCTTTDECSPEQFCQAGLCAPLPRPRVEFGFTDPDTDIFTAIENDQSMPFYAGFQGLSELYFTLRVSGLPGDENGTASIDVLQTATLVDTAAVLHEFGQPMVMFTQLESGELELRDRRVIMDSPPGAIDAANLELSVVLTARFEGREIVMEVVRQVRLARV